MIFNNTNLWEIGLENKVSNVNKLRDKLIDLNILIIQGNFNSF